jgi:hypothetical protein
LNLNFVNSVCVKPIIVDVMKNLLLVILISVCAIPAVNGQEAKSILKVKLTNNQPLTIEIDGRRFKKANRKLTVADVPKGKHYLKV